MVGREMSIVIALRVGRHKLPGQGLIEAVVLRVLQLQLRELLLGCGLLSQPLFARTKQLLLLDLERDIARIDCKVAPDPTAFSRAARFDVSQSGQQVGVTTH